MNPLRRIFQSTALVGLLALGAAASGQTQGYAQKTKLIRSAVLLLDADKPGAAIHGQTAAPFAFYNLDQAEGIKPTGWTFFNPNAPGATTAEIRARYVELGMPDANVPPNGTPLNKRSGAYWTVRLSQLSDTQIADYDVLLIAPRAKLSLNAYERERLRRFVDGGGTLWVDLYGATTLEQANNIPFALQRLSGGAGGNAYRDAASPVLDGPRRLTGGDLNLINQFAGIGLGPVALDANTVPLFNEFARYRTVASVSGVPVISEARLGDGTIVVTARGAAQLLNQAAAPSATGGDTTTNNIAFYAVDPKLRSSGRAAARLAINVVAISGGFRQANGGARKNGSASLDPGSPVLSRITAESTAPYGPNNLIESGVPVGAPVTYKGFLVATIHDLGSDNYRVVVFDAIPGRDLDGDGDEDDGIVNGAGAVQNVWRDVSVGKPQDVIWVGAPVDDPMSSPVCSETPEAGGANVDQILATDAAGKLRIYPLARRSGTTGGFVGGEQTPIAVVDPPDGAGTFPIGAVNPPTVYDGLAYMADTAAGTPLKGRIWVVDLSTGLKRQFVTATNPTGYWFVGGASMAGNPMPAFSGSPSIGYIPIQDNAGGLDRVLYVPGQFNHPAASQPGFVSIWLGSKGEKPGIAASGTRLTVTTRAGSNGQIPVLFPEASDTAVMKQMGIRLSITDQNGNPLPLDAWVTSGPQQGGGPGEIYFNSTRTQAEFDTVKVTVDYSIDWGFDPANLSGQIQRGRILLPIRKIPSSDTTQRILGPIALSPRGTFHLIQGPAGPGAAGGTYWAMREDLLRGSFRVVSRFTLHKKYNQTFGASAATNSVPQVLEDVDGVQNLLPSFIKSDTRFRDFNNFRYSGGVALRNGVAYAAINAERGTFNLPVTMLAAFRAEPETPEIRLGTDMGLNPKLVQADFARSDPAALVRTPVNSTLASNNLVLDTENGIIRVENLATVNREEITDCLSLSQPVGISSDGRAATLRYPEAFGDRWSPILWFGLWNGGTTRGAPLVAGNEVFLAADTKLFGYLGLGAAGGQTDVDGVASNGVVWSVDGDLPTTGTFALPLTTRPWIIQQAQISTVSGYDASPYYRMPQNRGVRSFDDWRLRLLQTKLGTSGQAFGVSGGDGTVAAWGSRGLYGMSRADFVVCDEGRLLRIDSSGNAITNYVGGLFSGVGGGGGASEIRPLVRPVKAYPVGTNEFLVVDAGGNRIVRLDDDGTELRSIDRITLDPAYKPAAYRVNQPLTFKDPRDAATFEGYVYKAAGDPEVVSNQGAVEYWVRYLVADSGHGRLVELADRYSVSATGQIQDPVSLSQIDPETGASIPVAQVGVLVWQSPSLEQSTKIGDYYHSVSRVFVGDFGAGRYVYVAGVGRTRPTRSSAGLDNPNAAQLPTASAGGAIVLFDPLGGVRVFDRFGMPNLRNTAFLANPATGLFDTTTAASRPLRDARPFSGLSAVTAQTFVNGTVASIRIMATDADAVYEFVVSSAVLASPNLDPTRTDPTSATDLSSLSPSWMMNEAAFTALRSEGAYGKNARYFRPAYARRLDSGDIVIVNGYRGLTRDGLSTYSGEVALVDGLVDYGSTKQNLGFSLSSLRFELPPLVGIRGLVSPVFADRR